MGDKGGGGGGGGEVPAPPGQGLHARQGGVSQRLQYRARIRKRLRSPGIDSKESIPPTYEAW